MRGGERINMTCKTGLRLVDRVYRWLGRLLQLGDAAYVLALRNGEDLLAFKLRRRTIHSYALVSNSTNLSIDQIII